MHISFTTVTWYSKLGAVLLFLLVVPVLCFYIGEQYALTRLAIEGTAAVRMVPSVHAQVGQRQQGA